MIVCTLYSPGEFYCQIANSNGKFLQLLFFSIVSFLSDLSLFHVSLWHRVLFLSSVLLISVTLSLILSLFQSYVL